MSRWLSRQSFAGNLPEVRLVLEVEDGATDLKGQLGAPALVDPKHLCQGLMVSIRWTSKMAKVMDPILSILCLLGYWAIILGSFGGPGMVSVRWYFWGVW